MLYPVNETFYSLKGEGKWTGFPMFFIRLSGCNLNCDFCDTPHRDHSKKSIKDLVELAQCHPSKRVVITGGEPTLHNLEPLIDALWSKGFSCHLETNMTTWTDSITKFTWTAGCPKSMMIDFTLIPYMNEIKILAGLPDWKALAKGIEFLARPDTNLYIMPLAKSWQEGDRTQNDLIQENIEEAIQFCKENPRFGLCMQFHKVLGIE
jgi:organic radical activating enzyme